ncbi:protein phosphatase 2C-like domain-containing protein 1 [Protopterus annectens]|uniref:protein phosphatase 2C-like domain-containing protein 1 n=1 Tax=Protopterus annectens TaxID=7888 RepID=UPI001CF944F4|nr:protein phosphatase 2C-like domain-containing protein 1 [Protopterus annectens]
MWNNLILPKLSEALSYEFQNVYSEISDYVFSKSPSEERDFADVTIPCSTCDQNVPPYLLTHHRLKHHALTVLGYEPQENPNIESLIHHRRAAITELLKSQTYSEKELQKIDSAYELLRLCGMPESYSRDEHEASFADSFKYAKKIINSFIKALVIHQDKNVGWKTEMEDAYVVMDPFGLRENTSFVGLFDGYHGKCAAETVANELPVLILQEMSKNDPSYKMTDDERRMLAGFEPIFGLWHKDTKDDLSGLLTNTAASESSLELVHLAHARAFWKMDRILKLGRNEVSRIRWSGCTALTCLIEGNICQTEENLNINEYERSKVKTENQSAQKETKTSLGTLHIANAGDIHAVLCKNGKGHRLTKDHSCSNPKERDRVLHTGGTISANEGQGLLEGLTNATRGLGHHGNPKLKKSVISTPYTISLPIDDSCQFLILASRGLWEVLDENEVVSIAKQALTFYYQYHQEWQEEHSQMSKSPVDTHICQSMSSTTSGHLESESDFKEQNSEKSQHKEQNSLQKNAEMNDNHETYLSDVQEDKTGQRDEQTEDFYQNVALSISKQLVHCALLGGSKENVSVLVVLLQGFDKADYGIYRNTA